MEKRVKNTSKMNSPKTAWSGQWSALVVSSVATLALSACGPSKTNPIEEYRDLQTVPRYESGQPRVQDVDTALFSITVNEGRNLNFVEGQSASYEVRPICRIQGAAYRLVANNLPAGAQFVEAEGGVYRLTWAPAVGTIVAPAQSAAFPVELAVEVLPSNDAVTAERLRRYTPPREIQLQVSKTSEQPVIERCELATGVACGQSAFEITEGESIAFSVVVKDIGAYQGHLPRLALSDDAGSSNEILRVAARRFVAMPSTPEVLGNSRYRFSGRIDTRGIEFPGSSSQVVARVLAFVVSPSGLMSAEQTIDVKVNRRPVEPVPAPAADASAATPAAAASNAPSVSSSSRRSSRRPTRARTSRTSSSRRTTTARPAATTPRPAASPARPATAAPAAAANARPAAAAAPAAATPAPLIQAPAASATAAPAARPAAASAPAAQPAAARPAASPAPAAAAPSTSTNATPASANGGRP